MERESAPSRRWRWPGLLALAAACGGAPPQPKPLQWIDLRPRERSQVYLNERLVLRFSQDLDPASVTAQSVRIATRDGRPARGTRFVSGKELFFLPDAVRSIDLRDGGYEPSTEYRIEVAGFPRADALRSTSGACLPATQGVDFTSVSVHQPRAGFVFEDDSPDQGRPLFLRGAKALAGGPTTLRVPPQVGLELEGEEPIDPSSFPDIHFRLERDDESRSVHSLRAVLVENHNRHAFPRQGTTLVRLVPDALLPPGRYRLGIERSGLGLRDFSGHQVPVIGQTGLRGLRIEVEASTVGQVGGEYLEEFLDVGMRSSAFVATSDGTAFWSNQGFVGVRYPAAAGDGSDGDLRWGESATARRVQAASFVLPEGVATRWDGGDGLCIVASQAALEIAGSLTREGSPRRVPPPTVAAGAGEPGGAMGPALSAWLASLGADEPLTVLIAGGDLRISGELSVPGPLLLVAGGRVRVSGRVRVAGADSIGPGYFARRGEAGAVFVWAAPEGAVGAQTWVADAGLAIDPPLFNRLVRPLRFAVRSNPIPAQGHAGRWLPAEAPRGRAGGGSLRVWYAGERSTPDDRGQIEVLVDDPALLVDCPTLRLVIELGLPAGGGGAWDPPMLDMVRVRWESDRSTPR